ncbi:MAG: carboxypeptidase regulatory-like domain-containing protein [Candidatus Lokiarchaeota archaeon]|nr:carboxypeptidase regulatory-like domain-containing protein [Candidatus Lokiarchaeota archaeon]
MMDNKFKKITIISILFIISLVPIVFMGETFHNNTLENNKQTIDTNLNTNLFSTDDYVPILDAPLQGLGNISISKLTFDQEGFINESGEYPNLVDDLSSGALNITYLGTNYLETVEIAQFNNLDDSLPQSNKITVLLNESISVQYNSSINNAEGYMIYNMLLFPRTLKHVFIQNQSDPDIVELTEEDYSIDSHDFLKFNFENYFRTDFHNFSMYFIFEYDLLIQGWELSQKSEETLTITQQEQTFSPSFYYNFTATGTKSTGNWTGISTTLADNLVVELIIDPLDKELFYEHTLKINDQNIIDFLVPDKRINVTMSADAKLFSLDFKANFTLRFENPVDYSWAIDRLYGDRNIRQRIYFPALIAGPEHIFLSDVILIEKTIISDQVIKNSSVFERILNYFDVIEFVTQETIENSLIFTDNAVKTQGLKIVIPYLILGEINPFSINYDATNDLKIIITDNTRMPLVGYRVELIYYGKKYGTYISNDLNQPMAKTYSDENGLALIENVPNGNYSVRIYQGNTLISETLINTFREVNYFITDIPHFPLWILIFGGISGLIFLIGLVFYFNYMKRS